MPTTDSAAWRTAATRAGVLITGLVVGMWILEGIDLLTRGALDAFGLTSWDFADLWSLITAPFIHFGFGHLIANTVPALVLGFLILLGGVLRWLKVTGLSALLSGLFAFFINPPHVTTAGFSGVIFGYLTYLIARGIFSRRWWELVMGVAILLAYGSVLWGVLPLHVGVSWQGHLGGAVGGLLAAWLLARRDRARSGSIA